MTFTGSLFEFPRRSPSNDDRRSAKYSPPTGHQAVRETSFSFSSGYSYGLFIQESYKKGKQRSAELRSRTTIILKLELAIENKSTEWIERGDEDFGNFLPAPLMLN